MIQPVPRLPLLWQLTGVSVGTLGSVASCVVEADTTSGPAGELALEAGEDPRAAVMGSSTSDCQDEPLESCDTGWTGPRCDIACDPGAPGCAFRYYCHSDGRIAGLASSRAHLFAFNPTLGPLAIRDRLEQWISQHEADLDMPDGLTAAALHLEPADNFRVEQGLLTLYRFGQSYPASATHPRVPVVGEGALVTLEADGVGAVTLGGTVVDPRVPYAHASVQAPASQARDSIKRYASLRTGAPTTSIEVAELQRVAVPWAEQLAWYGIAMEGSISLGRVIVSADPAVSGALDLLYYDDGLAHALHDTTPVDVRTQDTEQDPWMAPIPESTESTLTNGAPLVGSIFDGTMEPQLATEQVVLLDLLGNEFSPSLYDNNSMTWGFGRVTDAGGQFMASAPDDQFRPQRLYHLVQSGYAVVDRVASGKWDSAVSLYSGTLHSAYPAGTYKPRIIIGYNHAPIGHAGQAGHFIVGPQGPVLNGFPEAFQQPAPNEQNEPLATVNTPIGDIDPDVLFHETGHNFDTFLAPGYPDHYSPAACPGCTPCVEDSSDEANPLTETIAQMFAMWQLKRTFPSLPHDTCNLMSHLAGGTTNNQKVVHSPGCMDSSGALGLFLRDDDAACPDEAVCDKPSNDEADATMGVSHWCDATEGYNTYSILQAWWNMLHGLYCAPPGPKGVECVSQAVVWPPGCDQPGSGIDCATPDETAGLAFLYALRTNPTSYVQLIDGMARFVSCNYGPQAYQDFNQALCDHQIRACDAPAPLLCEQCGNGIREGSEECDGQDLSVDEIGYVPACTDFGYYDGGTLACQGPMAAQPCTYDFSQCTMPGLDDTGTTGQASTGGEPGTSSDGTDTAGGVGVEDGCGCRARGRSDGRGMAIPISLIFLLAARRRNRARGPRAAIVLALAATACAEDGMVAETMSESSTSATTETQAGSASETGGADSGWSEVWYGDYYEDPGIPIGTEWLMPVLLTPLGNMRIEAGTVTIERFYYTVDDEPENWTLATELDGDEIRVLPPNGVWDVLYPGAERVLLRPGTDMDCDELVLEAHGLPPPYDPVYSTRWFRGRLCVIDPYDESIANDRWMIDVCPGSVIGCDG